jgi:hypothetical protein
MVNICLLGVSSFLYLKVQIGHLVLFHHEMNYQDISACYKQLAFTPLFYLETHPLC